MVIQNKHKLKSVPVTLYNDGLRNGSDLFCNHGIHMRQNGQMPKDSWKMYWEVEVILFVSKALSQGLKPFSQPAADFSTSVSTSGVPKGSI